MSMSAHADSFVSVYSDARSEYTRQLSLFMVPVYFRFFINLLNKAKETTAQEPKKMLWQFQTYLNDIPEWNMEKLNNEITAIQNDIGCDYLDDLLTAVFIAHTKVLTAIRLHSRQKKIQITVPKVEHFLFKVLCETSKLIWGSSYLFSENVTNIEKQKNYRQIETLINDGIHQAIRALVPVKSILKDFVNQDDVEAEAEAEGEAENETEPETRVHTETENKTSTDYNGESEMNTGKETGHTNLDVVSGIETETIMGQPQTLAQPEALPQTLSQPEALPQTLAQPEANPVINITNTPKEVAFSQYVTVFTPTNPERSDIIKEHEDANSEETSSLSLDFLDEAPRELNVNEFESLDEPVTQEENATDMDVDDYEVLA